MLRCYPRFASAAHPARQIRAARGRRRAGRYCLRHQTRRLACSHHRRIYDGLSTYQPHKPFCKADVPCSRKRIPTGCRCFPPRSDGFPRSICRFSHCRSAYCRLRRYLLLQCQLSNELYFETCNRQSVEYSKSRGSNQSCN